MCELVSAVWFFVLKWSISFISYMFLSFSIAVFIGHILGRKKIPPVLPVLCLLSLVCFVVSVLYTTH